MVADDGCMPFDGGPGDELAAFWREANCLACAKPMEALPLDRAAMAQHYLVQVLTSGKATRGFAGKHFSAGIGDICIVDLAQPQLIDAEANATLLMHLPRRSLDDAVGSQSLHGVVLKADRPMTPLIAAYLSSLCVLQAPLSEMQALAAQEAMVTLLSAALKDQRTDDAVRTSSLGTRLRQSILEFIAQNIYLLELSPDFLCRRFNVSRAHLYRAFAKDGGVAKVLRNMRLDAAYRELTQVAHAARSITEIAYSLGFSGGNQLLRSFRSRFGVTPSEARAASGVRPPPPGVEAPSLSDIDIDIDA